MGHSKPSRSSEIRERLDYPFIKTNGHMVELFPVIFDYLKQVGGPEMAEKTFTSFPRQNSLSCYEVDHAQQPWQHRGSNENTNGLLRQYFPRAMDLSNIYQNRSNAVARQLNERRRETLNFETPAERFNQCVASTG